MSSIDEFRRYILQFRAEKNKTCTHTSIREPAARLNIPNEKLNEFFQMYRKAMVNRVPLHFTEKPTPISPMRVDLDFRFKLHNEGDGLTAPAQPGKLVRQYLPSDVKRIVKAYFEVLLDYLEVPYENRVAYLLEKPAPVEYRGKMKDGIHIIFPHIVVDNAFQYLVRKHIIDRGSELFDPLGLSNSYDDVVDEAIIENSNWQMYGSSKPNCEAYRVTGIYRYEADDDEASETSSVYSKPSEVYRPPVVPVQNKRGRLEPLPLPDAAQDLEYVSLLSMRNKTEQTTYHEHKQGEVVDYIRRVLPSIDDRRKNKLHAQIFSKNVNQTKNTVPDDEFKLAQQLMEECISTTRAERYDDWIKIGWCLRNIDYRLLNSWIKLSRVSSKYVEGECQKLWDLMRTETLGMGTLRWWARQDNKPRYEEIIDGNVLTLIDKCTGSDGAHFDIARVVHAMYKDRYRFTTKEIWYAFDEVKHRWVRSREGIKLRTILSTEVCTKFLQRSIHYTELAMRDADNRTTFDEKAKKLIDIAKKLKLSHFKASVMTECKCLFTDEKFEELLDSHPHLIGFENGVYDLRMHEFRDGLPDDYISFSTNIDYVKHDTKTQEVADIHNFFEKVFMNPDVRRYMWDILAMALDGGIRIERFFVCTGSGCHAKDTPILKYDGSMSLVQDIQVGDRLMGDDDTPRTVQQLFRGRAQLYQIHATEWDESFVVNGDHILTVSIHDQIMDMSVKEFLTYPSETLSQFKLVKTGRLAFSPKPLSMEPYTFGKWLGSTEPDTKMTEVKYIPMSYKTNTVECRLQLLAGLVDTLGLYQENTYRLKGLDSQLVEDVIYVARSLGIQARFQEDTLTLSGKAIQDIPSHFKHLCQGEDSLKYSTFTLRSHTTDDFYGFELDGNHRYAMGDFTITHNSNGKSRIYDLFQKAIGDYYCILPVSLITQKRAASNAAQSELERTKGRRFAVMQEPGENEKINIGLMKELTGGDRILARGLFKEPIEFRPQFKMVLTCNELPEVPGDDGGTWRRIRVIEFKSKFVEKPTKPNEFPLDVELSDKFENWAPVFISMLLEHHKMVDPKNIPEPSDVRIATESYKKNNDVVGQYVDERLEPVNDRKKRLKLQETFVDFKSWAINNIPKGKKVPDRNQLRAYIERSYGPYNNTDGWKCIQFRNNDRDALTKAEESEEE